MSNATELYCIESTSDTLIIEAIIQNELKRANGLPQELAVKVFTKDSCVCWDYDDSIAISFEQEKVLVKIVHSAFDSVKR
ncbi:hypothetical protein [Shewanella frigidimarina]|uniref:Uncharacterized protein n=1 Tax=Shewanella frigidimarina TaxID=56812 RepID=A0A125BER2_SHEFR|nr:hypothetical protein [Shewanella frigidimarina]KVX02603.1 hypothetical protein AWJ07_12895 [Shewanella frigidimarina]